jgi:hypothetical protein
MRLAIAALAVAAVALAGCSGEQEAGVGDSAGTPQDGALVGRLADYVRENHTTPEEYIVSKFRDHDIVFLGEYHRIRHDAELVQSVIPGLYEAGVYSLGMEFARRADQDDIDRLVTADTYDEKLAAEILWRQWPWWGFQEYADIFRAAWELNSGLPAGARPFRVFGLNAITDWSHVWTPEERADREVMNKVLPEGNSDSVMAETILHEFVKKREKALIYSGINHAYTEYRQPIYNASEGGFAGFVEGRMGNRVFDKVGKQCITVFLHAPWPNARGNSAPKVRPADGVIDAVIAELPPEFRRAGFDVAGTPFEDLSGESSLWSHGYDDFTLGTYCDGYIIQRPLSEYEGVAVIDGWFNEENREDAIAQIANPDPRVKTLDQTVEEMTESMAADTDMSRHFGYLW